MGLLFLGVDLRRNLIFEDNRSSYNLNPREEDT